MRKPYVNAIIYNAMYVKMPERNYFAMHRSYSTQARILLVQRSPQGN